MENKILFGLFMNDVVVNTGLECFARDVWCIVLLLQGTFLMTQAAARCMVRHKVKNGSIINIASIVGKVSA